MNGEHLMNGLELIPAGRRALKAIPAVALTLVLITALAACGVAQAEPDCRPFLFGAGAVADQLLRLCRGPLVHR